MINDNSIDFKKEYKKTLNELLDLQQKFIGLQKDWEYMKSLLDKNHDKNCKLKKENEELRQRIKKLEKEINSLSCGEADWLIDEML